LTEPARSQRVPWSRQAKSARAFAFGSQIALTCAAGADNKTVAAPFAWTPVTLSKWRSRPIKLRPDGLLDEDRPGRPSSITVNQRFEL
jgi:hypothetical protein